MSRQSTTFQDMVLEDETSRSEGTEQMTGEEPRSSTISTVNNDAIESKPKGSSIAEDYRYKRNDQSFLKAHKIGTWNVRSMNQSWNRSKFFEPDRTGRYRPVHIFDWAGEKPAKNWPVQVLNLTGEKPIAHNS
jgi:hypothetical protein